MAKRLEDGFSTVISFGTSNSLQFWEKEVTPPGYDMGPPIETTTMRNTLFITKSSRFLTELTEAGVKVSYNPAINSGIQAFIGTNQLITVTFPDASGITFWGYIKTWKPDAIKVGEQPMGELSIVPTNHNNTLDAKGALIEVAPTQF